MSSRPRSMSERVANRATASRGWPGRQWLYPVSLRPRRGPSQRVARACGAPAGARGEAGGSVLLQMPDDPLLIPVPVEGRRFVARRAVRLGDASPGGRLRLDAIARYLQDVAD